MSQPPYVDGFEFSACGDRRAGRWPLRALPRLRPSLVDDSGELRYELIGTQDGMGRRALRLKVDGVLKLSCQRCLETMALPLELDAILVLAATEAEIDAGADDPDAPDRVLASREMPIGELIEEEVLLSLPFALRHAQCDARHDDLAARRPSAFAGLSGLLDRPQRNARDRRR